MKKILAVILASLLLLSACGDKTKSDKKDNADKDTQTESVEKEKRPLGGIVNPDSGILYLDYDDPIAVFDRKEIEVTLSNGEKGTSYMNIPVLNVDLPEANEVSAAVEKDLMDKYGSYFENPDDRIIKVDYFTEDIYDMLILFVTEEITTPEGSGTKTWGYYYDVISDDALDIVSFSNYCGAQFATVYKAVLESEWAAEYEKETGSLPYEDVITAIGCKGDLLFTIYCTNPDGVTQEVLELQVEDVPLQLPNMEV